MRRASPASRTFRLDKIDLEKPSDHYIAEQKRFVLVSCLVVGPVCPVTSSLLSHSISLCLSLLSVSLSLCLCLCLCLCLSVSVSLHLPSLSFPPLPPSVHLL